MKQLQRRRRSKLSQIKSDWENGEADLFYIPSFLDRTKWTEKDWERSRKYLEKLRDQDREEARKQAEDNRKIYAKAKRLRDRKIIRAKRREDRKDMLAERKGRRLRRERMYETHNSLVLNALHLGDDTVGQISKRTELLTREARRALRRLIKSGLVTKSSERRYSLVQRKRRKRLSDAT